MPSSRERVFIDNLLVRIFQAVVLAHGGVHRKAGGIVQDAAEGLIMHAVGGVRIHLENARMSGTVCGTMRSMCGADAGC